MMFKNLYKIQNQTSPKKANHNRFCSGSPPLGTISMPYAYPQVTLLDNILLVKVLLASLLDNQTLGILAYQHASHIEGLGRLHRLGAG